VISVSAIHGTYRLRQHVAVAKVWLIRHAQSEANAGGASADPAGIPLTELGRRQAERIAEALDPPALIVTSPFLRARQTAEPTIARFPDTPCERWPVQEFTYLGELHGRSSSGLDRLPHVRAYWERADPHHAVGEAESFAELIGRVRKFLGRVRDTGPVAVFTHGVFIKAVVWTLRTGVTVPDREAMRRFRAFAERFVVPNGSITELRVPASRGCQDAEVAQPRLPHELDFVVSVPVSGTVTENPRFDLYLPADADGPRPAVIIVPGAIPAEYPSRPRRWPAYRGYGRLLANRGAVGVVVDQPYHDFSQVPALAEDLAALVASVRALDEVDADRIAVWAFSGGAMLTDRWLADSPDWLRCLALTYPVWETPPAVRPGRPVVLTRVGKELAERQAVVDRFLADAAAGEVAVTVIDVPDGQHGFDVLDHTERSERAVLDAAGFVVERLS
jgi:probable phosphoglycerate mutase